MTICPEDMWLLCWLYISSFSPANGLKGGSPPGASWLLQLLFSLGVEEEVERERWLSTLIYYSSPHYRRFVGG